MSSPEWMQWVPPSVRPHISTSVVGGGSGLIAPPASLPWQAPVAGGVGQELATFTTPGGDLRALVHSPAGVDPETPVPLVLMLHGCTQGAQAFAATTRMNEAADRHGFVVVYPEQDRSHNRQGCWNWFLPEHQGRDRGEPAALAGIVRDLIATREYGAIDPGRVFVAGFSAGGAMAATLAATHPDLFAAIAVHSGLAYRSADSVRAALRTMTHGDPDTRRAGYAAMGTRARPVPSMVIHGSDDRVVAPVNGQQVLRQTMEANRLAAPGECDFDVARPTSRSRGQIDDCSYNRSRWETRSGVLMHELLVIEGLGHAWSGGRPGGSYADPGGPSATEAICRFFAARLADGQFCSDERRTRVAANVG